MAVNELIDISPTLHKHTNVWPGDTQLELFWTFRMDEGFSCNVGGITMSLHTGSHVDAPLHFQEDGKPIDELPLSTFIGTAFVVEVRSSEAIQREDLRSLPSPIPERILIKTGSSHSGAFDSHFAYLSVEAANLIAKSGCTLLGTDTPSVDKSDSKELMVHNVLANRGVVIMEGLELEHVNEGWYELIAVPLKLKGMDASPVRAILRRTQ